MPRPSEEIAPSSPSRPRTATVVGGGPAGLIAAEVLAGAGLAVTVHEHMASVGRKLLLAGRGGLNLTHSEPIEAMLDRYANARPALEHSVRSFGPADLRAWCAGLGQATFVGSSGRVFPEAFRATPLLRAWIARLVGAGVGIRVRDRWLGWDVDGVGWPDGRRSRFEVADGSVTDVISDVTVLALGGASWPRVGSDGRWVEVLRDAGVTVHDLRPANSGMRVAWTDHLVERFAGVPLKNVSIGVVDAAGEEVTPVRGDATITRTGIEGGPVYALSAPIRTSLDRDGSCRLTIDLHPDLSVERLTERLRTRRPKDSATTALRRTAGLSPAAVAVLRDATGNRIPDDAAALAALVKRTVVTVTDSMPIDRAISSAGGIALDEIDDRFMLRRLPGVFVAGEMLDWEAPTGGYLLQASFSTGVAAARGALDWLELAATET